MYLCSDLAKETLLTELKIGGYEVQDNLVHWVEVSAREITAEQLSKIIGMVEILSEHIVQVDPNIE